MATGSEVLAMLIPNGGWVIYGDDFDSIIYNENVSPINEKEFKAGFAKYDKFKADQDSAKATAKLTAQAKLAELGLTVEDLTALGL
jgi:hypothetical protein